MPQTPPEDCKTGDYLIFTNKNLSFYFHNHDFTIVAWFY